MAEFGSEYGGSRLHGVSYAVFCAQLFGYLFFSTFLQHRYYHRGGRTPAGWKVQATVPAHKPDGLGEKARP